MHNIYESIRFDKRLSLLTKQASWMPSFHSADAASRTRTVRSTKVPNASYHLTILAMKGERKVTKVGAVKGGKDWKNKQSTKRWEKTVNGSKK